jgi:signal transduction histidine kinase
VEVADHLPPVHANAEQVRMAVRNLLENAFKYTPAHGTVTLGAAVNKDFVEIEVRDTGVGIPAEALPHIFDRFYRAEPAQRNGVRGSGLGLTLARAMVEANDGHIAVASEAGTGSVFTIQLPRERH